MVFGIFSSSRWLALLSRMKGLNSYPVAMFVSIFDTGRHIYYSDDVSKQARQERGGGASRRRDDEERRLKRKSNRRIQRLPLLSFVSCASISFASSYSIFVSIYLLISCKTLPIQDAKIMNLAHSFPQPTTSLAHSSTQATFEFSLTSSRAFQNNSDNHGRTPPRQY